MDGSDASTASLRVRHRPSADLRWMKRMLGLLAPPLWRRVGVGPVVVRRVGLTFHFFLGEGDEAIQRFPGRPLDCFAEPVIGPADEGRTRWLAMTML
jgi:hypothetical protein